MSKVINAITSVKLYTSYEQFANNVFLEALPSLVSFSEKTIINGTSETLVQLYDDQGIYQVLKQPIIQVSFQFNQTVENHYYGLSYSNVDTDELNRSVLRLNLSPVHTVYRRKFARSFTNNAIQSITECMTAIYEDKKMLMPNIDADNVRIPPACLSGTYERVFEYIRNNGQSVDSSDFCYLWEDGSGIYMKSNTTILAQTPLQGFKYNVSNVFSGDAIIFTTAEYVSHTDNTSLLADSSFFSFSMLDKKLYSDILSNTDKENDWVVMSRNAVYDHNFQNPDKQGKPYQAVKCRVFSSYERRVKFDVNQGRMDLKVGALIDISGDEYNGQYLVVECTRDASKDFHLQTIECVQVADVITETKEV